MTGGETRSLPPRWSERLDLTSDELLGWDVATFRDWFADGLDVFFSRFPPADRAFAFSPHHIDLEREDPVASLADYLRDLEDDAGLDAAGTLELRDRIQRAAVECMSTRVIVQRPTRASFVLDLFARLEARRLPEMARSSFRSLQDVPLEGPEAEEYLTHLCFIVYDNGVFAADDPLRDLLEARLRRLEDFQLALFYSLRGPEDLVIPCLARLNSLTSRYLDYELERSWAFIAEGFDGRFGKSAVAGAIREVIDAGLDGGPGMDAALMPATRLAPFYGIAIGLYADELAAGDDPNAAQRQSRGICS